MIFLIDHNLGGHAEILLGNIANQGWLELIEIHFVTFKEMNLPIDSNDRVVWKIAHAIVSGSWSISHIFCVFGFRYHSLIEKSLSAGKVYRPLAKVKIKSI